MADFTQSFLQGVQQGQQRAAQKKAQERADEEFDLKKQMLKVEMDKLKIAQAVAARKNAIEEAESMKNFDAPAQMQGSGAITPTGGPMPAVDLKAVQPEAVPMQIPAGGYGEAPMQVMAPTRTGDRQSGLKKVYEETRARRQAEADAPPTQDQIADNARLAQQAADNLELKKQNNEIRLMQAQSAAEFRAAMLDLRKTMVDDAHQKFTEARSPEAIAYKTDQVLKRKITIKDLGAAEKPLIEAELRRRGLDLPRTLTALEQNAQTQAIAGLAAIDTMDAMLKKDPLLPEKAVVPGLLGRMVPGVSSFKTVRGEASDILSRIRTGAAINESEIKIYTNMLPAAGDPPDAVQTKTAQFRGLFLAASGLPVVLVSPDGKQEAVIQDGYDSKQRSTMRDLIYKGWKPEY